MTNKRETPFGQWKSPIVSSITSRAEKSSRNTDTLIKDGRIYWTEARPAEKGRTVLMSFENDEARELTPPGFDVRAKVHEYGGTPYTVYEGDVYFINNKDQILYKQNRDGQPEPLTTGKIRLADLHGCSQGLVAIAEESTDNYLVLVDTRTGQHTILDRGHDFYSSPALSTDEKTLAWLTWDHPNMPWDGTQLWVAELHAGQLARKKCVAGGMHESIFQPQWSPDGTLYFASDLCGWWNLHRLQAQGVENVCPMEAEFGLPQWRLGMSTWGFTDERDQILCIYHKNGFGHLCLLDTTVKALKPLNLPYTDYSQLAVENGLAVMLMGSPLIPRRVVSLDLKTNRTHPVDVVENLNIDPEYISIPQSIEFPTTQDQKAYGYYYPPLNKEHTGPQGKPPPLIVISHGGPTGFAEPVFNLKIQYWTTRGFAVLDVNYRGSAGFGRAYRNSLRRNWGIFDVQDCEQGALFLAEQGLADKGSLFIRGGSAGGYTTLAALAFTKTFSAGASYYGVGDLMMLAKETHKFESRYLDSLIGPLPECEKIYVERSPLYHAGKITCPVIFFHGENDKAVPKEQSEEMHRALVHNHIPAKLIIYANEEHGFRQAQHIEDALNQELAFYLEVINREVQRTSH